MNASQSVHGGKLFASTGAEHLFSSGADAKLALSKLVTWEQEMVALQAAAASSKPPPLTQTWPAESRPSRGAKYFGDLGVTSGGTPSAASTALTSPRAHAPATGSQARRGFATAALRAARDAIGSPRTAGMGDLLTRSTPPSGRAKHTSKLVSLFASRAESSPPPPPAWEGTGQQPPAQGMGAPPKSQAQARGDGADIKAQAQRGGSTQTGGERSQGQERARPLRAGDAPLKLRTGNLNALKALEDHVKEIAVAERAEKQQKQQAASPHQMVMEEARMAAIAQQQLTPLGGGSSKRKSKAKVEVAQA